MQRNHLPRRQAIEIRTEDDGAAAVAGWLLGCGIAASFRAAATAATIKLQQQTTE